MAKNPKANKPAIESLSFSEEDHVRLLEDFDGVPADSEGEVTAVDPDTSSLSVNILRSPNCQPATGVLVAAPMDIFDKDCKCNF